MSCSDISSVNVLDLIPQRPPFIMIDCLTHFDPVITSSRFTVRDNNLFFSEGRLLASGLIENIAQTCAARIGYINRLSNEVIKLGFIGAVRNLKIYKTPLAGDTICTTITVKEEVFQMTLVDAVVKLNDETIAEAEMKIALSDIES
ncbi:pseudouridylate synthase [Bacteroides sp. AN502]|nr:pseudouridylate synthase [Caecibacteroides pullorum]MDC6280882.1 pseudouridylate synthase [Caecibacteroides pullorum]